MPEAVFHATTIVALRHAEGVAMAGDGQVTLDKVIFKHGARKIRRMAGGKVLAGFAGSAADGLTLYEKFEARLEEYRGNLRRAAVELAKDWRTDKALRRLEALMIVADKDSLLVISGTGDVIEPDDGVVSIGSGGPYALAAARALMHHSSLSAVDIAREALTIASTICIYTNSDIIVEAL